MVYTSQFQYYLMLGVRCYYVIFHIRTDKQSLKILLKKEIMRVNDNTFYHQCVSKRTDTSNNRIGLRGLLVEHKSACFFDKYYTKK